MSKKVGKILLLLIVVGVGLPSLFIYGFKGLTSTIYESMDCNRFNIDHVEMRAGVNVPPVSNVSCNLDPVLNRRDNLFEFDSTQVDMDIYIPANKLKAVTNLEDYPLLKNQLANVPGDWYGKKKSETDHEAEAIADKKTGQLWVAIQYKD